MGLKKLSSIGFTVMLLLMTFTAIGTVPVGAEPLSSVEVVPSTPIEGHYVSETFNVNITFKIENVTGVGAPGGTPGGLYGFEYKFSWNETLINVTSWTVHIPPTWLSYYKAKDLTDINATTGLRYHWLAISGTAGPPPASPFIGNMTICEYAFHVEYAPYYPEPDMNCSLDVYDDKLSDKAAKPITHSTTDGFYFIKAGWPPAPAFEIKEKSIVGMPEGPVPCGGLFNVSVQIKGLAWQWRIMGWEVKLGYNTTLLDAVASYEGPFLKPFAGPNGTYYINKIFDAAGYVQTAGLFCGFPAAWPYGTGVVAIIEFNATYQTIAPEVLKCDLTLYDTKLVDKDVKPVDHTVLPPSTYQAPYKILGWGLDCWTDSFRKKCVTPFTGVGINKTADAYEPQDLVILYAKLTYNEEPEANKLVMFEVHGPPNPYQNISVIRTAYTNKSGIATIQFTIPWPCEHAEEQVFGHWVCYQAAQVKIYQKPEDWLWFKVGWIVQITDVEVITHGVNPKGVKECELIEIIIHYKNIMFIPKWVLFTVVVYDELLDPIQEEYDGTWVEPAEYRLCAEAYGNFTLWSHIPQWAHVGKATVYVNAFTDLPMHCGCPYCPEVTETFWILKTSDP